MRESVGSSTACTLSSGKHLQTKSQEERLRSTAREPQKLIVRRLQRLQMKKHIFPLLTLALVVVLLMPTAAVAADDALHLKSCRDGMTFQNNTSYDADTTTVWLSNDGSGSERGLPPGRSTTIVCPNANSIQIPFQLQCVIDRFIVKLSAFGTGISPARVKVSLSDVTSCSYEIKIENNGLKLQPK